MNKTKIIKTLNFMKENHIQRVKFTSGFLLSYDFEREEYSIWEGCMLRKTIVHRDLDTFVLKASEWVAEKEIAL